MASISSPTACRKWLLAESLPVALLLVFYVAMTLTAIHRKSCTFDELYHLTTGYAHWQTRDYQLAPQNGLPQEWAALALLPGSWAFPSLDDPPWSRAPAWHVGWRFFYELGNDADAMLFRARALHTVLAAALGLLVYGWSCRLFGRAAGLVSLTLFATCPTMLANGPLVTADLAAALFFTAAVAALWKLLHRLTPVSFLVSGLAVSALMLSKMSAFFILPTGLLLAGLRLAVGHPWTLAWRGREISVRSRAGQVLVLAAATLLVGALVWGVIWAFFGFRYDAIRPDRPGGGYEYVQYWPQYLNTPGLAMQAAGFARAHHLLPEAFLFSFADVFSQVGARAGFLNGEHYTTGNWRFFPYCLLVKTSSALLVLLVIAAVAMVPTRRRGQQSWARVYQLAPLLVFLGIYWAFALASHVNIGLRHLLPVYPAMYILAGGAALWLTKPAWRPRAVLGACLLVATAEALVYWPHYRAYFNLFAGGPRHGYQHLVDSSLDWGQDLKELARWLEENGARDRSAPVYLAYFGSARPEYYGIQATTLPSYYPRKYPDKVVQLRGGTYCVSATMLQGVYAFELFRSKWGEKQEVGYFQALAGGQRLEAARNDPQAMRRILQEFGLTEPAEFRNLYEQARFARLCAFLRRREPDYSVGYSILIYRLSDADVEQALYRAPPFEVRGRGNR